jgi:hypothetical protein
MPVVDLHLVSLVTGVDRWGAQPPAGFPHRFAVLTWRTLDGDGGHPWLLLRAAAPELVRLTAADAAVAEFWRVRRSPWGLRRRVGKTGETPLLPYVDRDERVLHDDEVAFPDELRFERGGRVVLCAETEFWDAAGGPAPYADSVALSFSSPSDRSGDLEELFRRAAAGTGAEVVEAHPTEDGAPAVVAGCPPLSHEVASGCATGGGRCVVRVRAARPSRLPTIIVVDAPQDRVADPAGPGATTAPPSPAGLRRSPSRVRRAAPVAALAAFLVLLAACAGGPGITPGSPATSPSGRYTAVLDVVDVGSVDEWRPTIRDATGAEVFRDDESYSAGPAHSLVVAWSPTADELWVLSGDVGTSRLAPLPDGTWRKTSSTPEQPLAVPDELDEALSR